MAARPAAAISETVIAPERQTIRSAFGKTIRHARKKWGHFRVDIRSAYKLRERHYIRARRSDERFSGGCFLWIKFQRFDHGAIHLARALAAPGDKNAVTARRGAAAAMRQKIPARTGQPVITARRPSVSATTG